MGCIWVAYDHLLSGMHIQVGVVQSCKGHGKGEVRMEHHWNPKDIALKLLQNPSKRVSEFPWNVAAA
jgi:hypothetical protein